MKSEIAERWPEWALGADRRARAAERRALYVGNYAERVRKLVLKRIDDKDTAHEVASFVNAAHGLVGAVADACAVVYQRGAQRELRGAAEPVARAFADLVTESGMPSLAPALNALSWVLGPVTLIPYTETVRGVTRLCLHVVTADRAEVRRNLSRPDSVDAVLFERDDGVLVEVDAEAWRFYTAKGEPLDGGAHDAPHPLGYCPAVPFRSRPWLTTDWWGELDHVGLCDAAIEVAYTSALGRWTRTQTAAPMTEITAPDNRYAKQQSLGHPSRPVVFDAAPAEVRVAIHDRTTDPSRYIGEIQAHASAAVARYGLPPSAATFANGTTLTIAAVPGVLALQRDAQAPLLIAGERALWQVVCDVVRVSDHRHARTLPEAAEVESMLRVAFPDLADPADQKARMEVFELQLPHGLASAEEVLMQARPELTRAEAREEIQARRTALVEQYEELARRNIPADATRAIVLASATDGVESIAQSQGRAGGQASGAARREENATS